MPGSKRRAFHIRLRNIFRLAAGVATVFVYTAMATFEKDTTETQEEALIEIYKLKMLNQNT